MGWFKESLLCPRTCLGEPSSPALPLGKGLSGKGLLPLVQRVKGNHDNPSQLLLILQRGLRTRLKIHRVIGKGGEEQKPVTEKTRELSTGLLGTDLGSLQVILKGEMPKVKKKAEKFPHIAWNYSNHLRIRSKDERSQNRNSWGKEGGIPLAHLQNTPPETSYIFFTFSTNRKTEAEF